MALEDKLVELDAQNAPISATYHVAPAPAEGEPPAADPFWSATISSQGNPYEGEGTSLDAAITAAIDACESRGLPESEPK